MDFANKMLNHCSISDTWFEDQEIYFNSCQEKSRPELGYCCWFR